MMSGVPDVSVIIPCYRSHQTIQATLDSIKKQDTSRPLEVIVIDSSGDGTAESIARKYPGVQVVESPVRLYPGAARNRGVHESRGSYLAFLDADVVAEPNWLEMMAEALQSEPEFDLVGGWVGNANPEYLTSQVLYWIEFSEALPGRKAGPSSRLASCNWFIRRAKFVETGGFDESFSMSEDMILSDRLKGQIYFQNQSGVWHTQRVGVNEIGRHLKALGYWSGRHRKHIKTEGSFLVRMPWASFGLPLFRGCRILRRTFQSDWKEGLRCLVLSPFLIAGLSVWAWGFFRGLRIDGERRH